MSDFDRDKCWEGNAYYETSGIGTAEGFVSVDVEDEKEKSGVIISAYAYDQGRDASPVSVSVHMTVDSAREYAQQILKACEAEEAHMQRVG